MRPAYPRPFWVLFAGTLVNRLGMVVLPFLALFLTSERGLTIPQATLVVGLYGAGAFSAGFVGGWLSDAVGRRPVLVGSLLGGAALIVALPRAEGLAAIAALTFAFGVVSEAYRPAVSASVADLVPEGQRTRAYALLYWAINLGVAIGPALGGLLAERVGFASLFLLDGLTMAAYAGIVWAGVPETRPTASSGAGSSGREARAPRRGLATALRDGHLLALAAVTLAVGAAFQQGFSTLPLVMDGQGLGESVYGLVIAVNGAVIVVLSLPLARWAERHVGPGLLAGSVLLIGAGLGAMAWASSFWPYAAATAVMTIGEILFIPIMPTLVARRAPARLQGTYQGVYHSGWGLSKMVGPPLGGLVLAAVGGTALWAACFALSAVTALGIGLARLGAPAAARELP